MRVIFLGTPDFAKPSLARLLESQHAVSAVVTVPDRLQGRGRQLKSSPVKAFARKNGLRVYQPDSLKDPEFIQKMHVLAPDMFVVVAFRILPETVFTIPSRGTINLHGSLLPKYRGAAPIQWALLKGDSETGVTTFFIQKAVDTGNVLLQRSIKIGADETFGELHDRLAFLGAQVLVDTVDGLADGTLKARQQNNSLATKAPKITPEMLAIDFFAPAQTIHNQIRAFSPKPGAYTTFRNTRLKILRSSLGNSTGQPGQVISISTGTIEVACGEKSILVRSVQPAGKRAMEVRAYLAGNPVEPGDFLG